MSFNMYLMQCLSYTGTKAAQSVNLGMKCCIVMLSSIEALLVKHY